MTEEDLMLKFLRTNYPVCRIKHNTKFKKAIKLDTGNIYLLSDQDSQNKLLFSLLRIVTIVFGTTERSTLPVLREFLHIK